MPLAKLVIKDEVNVRIRGLDPQTIQEAHERLSYYVPGFQFMPSYKLGRWDGKIRLFQKSGATALNLLQYVGPVLDRYGYDLEIAEDHRKDYGHITDQIKLIDETYLKDYVNRKTGDQITLWDHQVEGVNRCLRNGSGILELATGSGKAQPLTSLVATPSGWKAMGDISVGDIVCTWGGKTTTVTDIHPQPLDKTLYEIEFQDGRKVKCCDEHLWYVYDKRVKRSKGKNGLDRFDVLPAKTIKRIFDTGGGGSCLQIPLTETFGEPTNVSIDPYVLGILLGDGCLVTDIQFSTNDEEIVEHLRLSLPDNPITKIKGRRYDYRIGCESPYSKNDSLRVSLEKFGLRGKKSHEKFIPEIYKKGTIEQRYSLLQGLMDTDGYVSTTRANMSYSTSSKQLAEDVTALVRSLGGIAKITSKNPYYRKNGKKVYGRVNYMVWIQLPEPERAVRLTRKKKLARKTQYSDGLTLRITGIKEIGHEPTQCISVKDKSRVYITDGNIVTHNTFICGILSKIYQKFGRVVVIVPNLDLLVNTQKDFESIGIDTGMWYGQIKERKQVTVATWQSLDHFPELFEDVKCVIVDEVHEAKAAVLSEMLSGPAANVPFRFGCSGTIPKEELFRRQLEANVGEIIFTIRAWELQEKNILAKSDVYQIVLADTKNKRYRRACATHTEWSDELNWFFRDKPRVNFIAGILGDIAGEYGNTLVLIQYKKHGKILQATLPGSVSLDGDDKNRNAFYEEFNQMNNQTLICTYGIAKKGIDIPRIFNLVFIEPGKKFETVIQTVGRGLRKAKDKERIKIFDICGDSGLSAVHSHKRRTLYNEARHSFEILPMEYANADSDG